MKNFNWGTANNNGNLLGGSEQYGASVPASSLGTFNQSYAYDNVNRLISASDSGGWSESLSYDAFGNMWESTSGLPTITSRPTSNVYNAQNRMSTSRYPQGIGPMWKGDGRSFSMAPNASSRAQVVMKIETDPAKNSSPLVGTPVASTSGSAVNVYGLFTATANSDVKASISSDFRLDTGTSVVGVSVNASDPLLLGLAPSTGGNFTFNVSSDGSNISVNGTASVYPAWEINVQNDSTGAQGALLQYTPAGTSAGSPGALLTGATVNVKGRTSLPDKPQRQCSSGSGTTCPQ